LTNRLIEVTCPVCKRKFRIPERLSGFSFISCYKRGGHAVGFEFGLKGLDHITDFTIERAIKDIEKRFKTE